MALYKFFNTPFSVLVIIITFLISHNSGTPLDNLGSITSDPIGFVQKFATWLWGPSGTLTVYKVQKGASTFSKLTASSEAVINIQPLWSALSLTFPIFGMEGVMVKANPPDACYNLEEPPKHLTSSEYLDEKVESNSSDVVTHWFLIADDGDCDFDTKIRNADDAGYSIIIIGMSDNATNAESGTTEETNSTAISEEGVKIYSCTVSDTDGKILSDYFTYPLPFTATVMDLRKFQWSKSIWKIVGMALGGSAVVAGAGATAYVVKKKMDKKAKPKTVDIGDLQQKVAEDLPSTKWRSDESNMRLRCKYCHQRFNHDNDVVTLACTHQFHKSCILPRIVKGGAFCPLCTTAIHSIPPIEETEVVDEKEESTEATPLLKQKKESPPPKETVQKYHCHICEILGLPYKEEIELVRQLSEDGNFMLSSSLHFDVPSIHQSSASISIKADDEIDEEAEADLEVARITDKSADSD